MEESLRCDRCFKDHIGSCGVSFHVVDHNDLAIRISLPEQADDPLLDGARECAADEERVEELRFKLPGRLALAIARIDGNPVAPQHFHPRDRQPPIDRDQQQLVLLRWQCTPPSLWGRLRMSAFGRNYKVQTSEVRTINKESTRFLLFMRRCVDRECRECQPIASSMGQM
jgi:hypothetical protein